MHSHVYICYNLLKRKRGFRGNMKKRKWYKSYIHSTGATVLSIAGTLCCDGGLVLIAASASEYFIDKKAENNDIIYIAILGIILLLCGAAAQFLAKVIAKRTEERLLDLSYLDAEKVVERNPKLKDWFMEKHNGYRQFHEDEYSFDENYLNKNVTYKNISRKDILLKYFSITAVVIVFVCIADGFRNRAVPNDAEVNGTNVINENTTQDKNGKKSSSDKINENKYQAYVTLNNDIVECYNYSINLYIRDKGAGETPEDKHFPEKLDMAPIMIYKYDDLKNIKALLKSKPEMDIDDQAERLIDEAEKVFVLTNQIYYAYGNQENDVVPKVETSMTKEELHKEYLNAVQKLDEAYSDFYAALYELEEEHTAEELEQYKKSGDIESYETLNVLVQSQRIYDYLASNNINNDNLFDMNLDEYNKILQEYNEAYAEFASYKITGNSCHTGIFCDQAKEFNTLANNILSMVNEKNLKAGEDKNTHGVKASGASEDIQDRLYDLIDKMTSSYNSIQSFKNS